MRGHSRSLHQPSDSQGSAPLPFVIPKPRDLRFCRPVLGIFFEEAVGASSPVEPALSLSKGPTAKGQPAAQGWGIDSPTLSERRRRGTLSPQPASLLCRKNISRKGPQNRRSLGFAPNEQNDCACRFSAQVARKAKVRGIPHLAKNARDMGHPSLVAGREPNGRRSFRP